MIVPPGGFGWRRQLPDLRDFTYVRQIADLPPEVDLRGGFPAASITATGGTMDMVVAYMSYLGLAPASPAGDRAELRDAVKLVAFQQLTYFAINEAGTYRLGKVQAALAEGSPVLFGASAYESFCSKATADTGLVSAPSRSERLLGGLPLLAVGYRPIFGRTYFLCRAPWGADWGVGGYCYLPAAYLGNPKLCADFWVLTAN